jgi:hypothetical protein
VTVGKALFGLGLIALIATVMAIDFVTARRELDGEPGRSPRSGAAGDKGPRDPGA